MHLLFDLKTCQHFIGGGSEYIRKVFFSLLKDIKEKSLDIQVFALFDSRVGKYAYKDLSPTEMGKVGVSAVDIANSSLKDICSVNSIDMIFIGCGQFWREYDIENIKCPVLCVIHDLCDEEYAVNHLSEYVRLHSAFRFLKNKIGQFLRDKKGLRNNKRLIQALIDNPKATIVTVSNFSKHSIMYNYHVPESKIKVLYSPHRITNTKEHIENSELKTLLESKKKYFLMVSSNRIMKNASKTIQSFKHFAQIHNEYFLVTVGYGGEPEFQNHVVLPYLSDNDLNIVMKECFAFIFPSYFEGFGYPPIEAMSYGKPVLCSNTTSIPEIVGNAAIYFSPFFESDIYRALQNTIDADYAELTKRSKQRYKCVSERQDADLSILLNAIETANR